MSYTKDAKRHFAILTVNACSRGDTVALRKILDMGVRDYEQILQIICASGNKEMFDFFIDYVMIGKKKKIHVGNACIQRAAESGNPYIVSKIFELGAIASHSNLRRAAMQCVHKDNVEAFKIFFENGVNGNEDCLELLKHACHNNRNAVFDFVISKLSKNVDTEFIRDLFFTAIDNNNYHITKRILKNSVSKDAIQIIRNGNICWVASLKNKMLKLIFRYGIIPLEKKRKIFLNLTHYFYLVNQRMIQKKQLNFLKTAHYLYDEHKHQRKQTRLYLILSSAFMCKDISIFNCCFIGISMW